MKRLFRNVIAQYTIITLVVIVVISAVLGIVITRRIEDHVLKSHVSMFPPVIRTMVKDHPVLYNVFSSRRIKHDPSDLNEQMNDLFTFGSVFRVKLWGKDGTILWSDRKEIVGKKYQDNPQFIEAMKGRVSYEMTEPHKVENATEAGRGRVLEIYVPVERNGEILGVLEVYESVEAVYGEIQDTTQTVWIWVTAAGYLLYTLLFVVFYRSYTGEQMTARRLHETQDATIMALAYQAELRDREVGRHIERTSQYVEILARELGTCDQYRSYLTNSYIEDLVKAAPLHDIGKVGIPDAILNKPGALTDQEFEHIKQHCEYGALVLKKAEEKLTFQSFLKIAMQMVMYHHENWNGRGYPHGLSGKDIPLSARIMAVADVYDAVRSRRPYKNPLSHAEAISIILQKKGEHLDPEIVEVFLRREKEFAEIALRMADK
ncbi:MAG TPA: HD domain-containing phosphohydrolase [Nitrospirota bacterium]|nr:HD domain-containing phosphohydrolase [Nitrospirota bacterium]